jgi:glycosyltransferase involved in cell wall biosynthesis
MLDCDDYEAGSGHFKGAWQRRGVAWFERNVPRWVRGVTTNTQFMQEKLASWGVPPSRIFHLPNGVDAARFASPDPARVAALCAQWDLTGKQVVAFIGTMSLVSHPVNLLVDAFADLVRTHPAAILLLVGGGEDVARIKEQAEQIGVAARLRCVGRVPPADVRHYYALADVSVDPVYDDPAARGRSPLKMFESWACGVPFVTADVGERRRSMGDPPAGGLVRAGDAPALADALRQGLADGARWRALGHARVQEFEWDRLAGGVVGFYQRVLEGI